jgi:peptidoglycan hydrolase-like protein with peptidoglycan-binding domain
VNWKGQQWLSREALAERHRIVWRDDLGDTRNTDLIDCPLWLAKYPFAKGKAVRAGAAFDGMAAPPVPPPWGDEDNWWIHQYQGDAVDAPGFPSGNVDMNRFNPLYDHAGKRVLWVKERLRLGLVDDQMDVSTRDAIKAFQTEHGLVPDGIIGPRTFAYLAWQVL